MVSAWRISRTETRMEDDAAAQRTRCLIRQAVFAQADEEKRESNIRRMLFRGRGHDTQSTDMRVTAKQKDCDRVGQGGGPHASPDPMTEAGCSVVSWDSRRELAFSCRKRG